jgi:hypothetical protein
MPKRQARNPVSEEDAQAFDAYVEKWRDKLNLRDWRVVRAGKRDRKNMAALLTVEHEHKLARYAIGEDFGASEVTPASLEGTALHEMLHLLLRPLLDVAMQEKDHSDLVLEKEHEVVLVLEQLLLSAYGGDQ